MEEIDASLRSLEDSLDRLSSRFRGSEPEVLQLFRARLLLDQAQAAIAAARANGQIDRGWGAELVSAVNNAAMLVAVVPSAGGTAFQSAMQAVEECLDAIMTALKDGIVGPWPPG